MRICNKSVLALTLVLLSNLCLGAIDIYVATDGNNSNPGTINSPLASLAAARDMIRGLRPGSIGINGATEVTIATWVYPDAKDDNDGIITCTGNTYFGLLFSGYGTGNPLEFRAMGTGLLAPNNSCPAGSWHHVAGVWKSDSEPGGGIHKLYINGVEVASDPDPPVGTIDASNWYIGTDRFIGGRFLDGQTQDVYIWDRALSVTEIAGLAATTPVIPSDHKMSHPDLTTFNNSNTVELPQYIPPLSDAVNVWIRGGRYPVTSTLNLALQDSGEAAKPIIYREYPGEEVIFDGSLDIGNDGFAITSDSKLQGVARGRTYVKTITDSQVIAKLQDYRSQISVDDQVMQLSRFPNIGFDKMTLHTADIQIGEQGTPSNPLGAVVSMSKTFKGDWQTELARIQKARLTGYVSADWLSESLRIHSVAPDNRITLMDGSAYGFGGPSHVERAYVSNLLCEIDEPGEWYFDDIDNKLYIWPRSPIDGTTVIGVWAGPRMISLDGCKYISFENITMQGAGSSGGEFLYINNCDNVGAAGCIFRNCSPLTVAIRIQGASTNCGLLSCDFYDVHNATALYGQTSTNSSITHSNNYIENCHFTQIWSKSLYGKVSALKGAGNIFRNNLMHNHNGQVVTLGGQDHVIELNEIFNTGVEEGDGGSFYQGASFTSWGNTFQHNFWHHIICIPLLYDRSAIFSDDGDLGDIVNENVFYKAGDNFKINQGAGHTGSYNVMLDSIRGIYVINGNPTSMYNTDMSHLDSHTSVKDAHLYRAMSEFGIDGWETGANSTNWYSYISSYWLDRYPRMDTLFYDWWVDTAMNKYCDFDHNIFYSNDSNASVPSATTVTSSTYLSDLDDFVDPSVMNFKFEEPRPSWAPDIPFENIGLYVDTYRTTIPNKDSYRQAVKDHWNGVASNPGSSYNVDEVNERIYYNTGKLIYGIPDPYPASYVDLSATTYNYDFGTTTSPEMSGWTRITPNTNGEISWSGPVDAVDRGGSASANDINRDLIYSSATRTFEHKIANGIWDVTLNMGDDDYAHDNMVVRAEGITQDPDVDSAAGSFPYVSFTVTVTDGSLSIEFSDNGGSDNNWVLTRMSLSLVSAIPPAAPSSLTAAVDGDSRITLSWTDNSTDETSFKIERKTGAGGTWQLVATVPADTTSYSDSGLTVLTEEYYYRVNAYSTGGDSGYSNEASAFAIYNLVSFSRFASCWQDEKAYGIHAYWPMEDGGGTVLSDESGNGYDASISGPVWTSGIIGQALDFDGSNDYVSIPALDLNSNTITITVWIKRNGSQDHATGIFYTRSGSTADAGVILNDENKLWARWTSGPDWHSNLQIPDGSWVLIAYVIEPSKTSLYLHDGTLHSESNIASYGSEEFDGTSYLGWDQNYPTSRYFDGSLDDVRIYNYALSAQEIDDLYNSQDNEPCVDFDEFDFDQNRVINLADFSGFVNRWLD